jgi:hypothetical protein
MKKPQLPGGKLVATSEIPSDSGFGGLKVVWYSRDESAQKRYDGSGYEFQHDLGKRHQMRATLSLKGSPKQYRIAATAHLTLREFVEVVRYDPSNPPLEDYDALQMKKAHEQTQSDFKGAKKANTGDFKQYIIEAFNGERVAYLPTVAGWQSTKVFGDTIFVAFDEPRDGVLYGDLYLPKKPVMQADGQTQTAALFQAAVTELAVSGGMLDDFLVTLEIELNVQPDAAGQSFADRNGRGTKKNKNLVAGLDLASALSTLRNQAVKGTVFEHRLATGRSTGTSETATENIVDLSTLEQMLLNVISHGTKKPEHIKHHHVKAFLPYAKDFLKMLDGVFGSYWPKETPDGSDPYRRLYVHGWPFALKAIALAYHQARVDQLGPLADAIAEPKDREMTVVDTEKDFLERAKEKLKEAKTKDVNPYVAQLSPDKLKDRLSKIDWHRQRKHWVVITSVAVDQDGAKKTRTLKDGSVVVQPLAPNTKAVISAVEKKILSKGWKDLCSKQDAPLK